MSSYCLKIARSILSTTFPLTNIASLIASSYYSVEQTKIKERGNGTNTSSDWKITNKNTPATILEGFVCLDEHPKGGVLAGPQRPKNH